MTRRFLSRCLSQVGLLDSARSAKRLFWSATARQRRRQALAFYSQFIRKDDLCFDIGANVGARTDIFWRLGARTVAVEPQPHCAQELRRLHGHHASVAIVESAVGSAVGKERMWINDGQSLVSSMSRAWMNAVVDSGRWTENCWDRDIVVPVTTLDQLIAEQGFPRFCKIDVEGYELKVLLGLSHHISVVSLEFTQERLTDAHKCLARLVQLGPYEFNFSLGESFDFDRWDTPESMLQRLRARLEGERHVSGDIYARA